MKFTIGTKLLSGFLSIALLLVATSGVSFYFIKQIDSSYSDLVDRRSVALKQAIQIENLASREISNLRGILLQEEGAEQAFREVVQELDEKIAQTGTLVRSEENIANLKKLSDLNRQVSEKSEQVIELAERNPTEALAYATKEAFPLAREIRDLAGHISQNQQAQMDEGSRTNTETVRTVVSTVLITSVAAVGLAVIIGYLVSRMISKPVVQLSRFAARIANGDLTAEPLVVKHRDEIGDLVRTFNRMTDNLRELIRNVDRSAEQVAAASESLTVSAEQTTSATEQIAVSIQEVASGAEAQVDGLEECARAMQEMTSGIQQVAESASAVSEAASATRQEAKRGNEALQDVVAQMKVIHDAVTDTSNVVKRLEERSGEIDEITQAIAAISSQTNILAMNAAIEAARAGEQGRGFSVVASEVKKLAEQSKQSADQIAKLIQDIKDDTMKAASAMERGAREVTEGLSVVDVTKEGFENIWRSVEKVAEQIQETSAVAQQMSASVEEVNASMENIAHLAKESTNYAQSVAGASEEQLASIEEVTTSAESLSQMAVELRSLIHKFKV